jgi:hypothetical protein
MNNGGGVVTAMRWRCKENETTAGSVDDEFVVVDGGSPSKIRPIGENKANVFRLSIVHRVYGSDMMRTLNHYTLNHTQTSLYHKV